MIHASAHLPQTILDTISDSNIVAKVICEGCKEQVTVRRVIMPIGPDKGKSLEMKYGCKCEDKAIESQVLERRKELKKVREKERLFEVFDQNSLINSDLREVSFETYLPNNPSQEGGKKAALQYIADFSFDRPENLLLTGSYGLGKSHLAAAILKELIGKGHTGIFISVPKLLTKLKATYRENSEFAEDDLLTVLEQADCLVLDDIGAEHGTDHSGSWSIAKVFEVVDSRLGKHTIYTTNLKGAELQAKVGARNFSRMMQQTEVLTMVGEDFRLRQFKS